MDELWGCFKYVKIPFDELNHMPTKDRKYYISKHNREVEEENAKWEKREHGGNSTNAIDMFTDMDQKNIENAEKR